MHLAADCTKEQMLDLPRDFPALAFLWLEKQMHLKTL